jgi:hypothetical protein
MSVLLSLALFLAPLHFDTGKFNIFQDGKKLGTEEYTLSPHDGGYTVEGHTELKVQDKVFDLKSEMELNESLQVKSYEFHSEGSTIRLTVGDPVSNLEYTVAGKSEPHDVRFPANGAIIDANFFHHYMILLYRAELGLKSVAVFVPQQLTIGTMTIEATGEHTYEMNTGNVKVIATTDKDGKLMRLEVPAAKVIVER